MIMKVAVPLPKHSPMLGQRFLAHRVQLLLAQDVLDLVEARGGAARLDADPLGLLQHFALLDLDGDARELGRRFLLGQRVVVFGWTALRARLRCCSWCCVSGREAGDQLVAQNAAPLRSRLSGRRL